MFEEYDLLELYELLDRIQKDENTETFYIQRALESEISARIARLNNEAKNWLEVFNEIERAKEKEREAALIKRLCERYPGCYKIANYGDYLILKEVSQEDGEEITRALVKIGLDVFTFWGAQASNRIFAYEDYQQQGGRIYYGKHYMTIGKARYDDWLKTFGE